MWCMYTWLMKLSAKNLFDLQIIDEIITRLLHLEFLPLIEKIVGRKMEPTYTYISAYVKGADLPAHTDRPKAGLEWGPA